jgi:hypothetical protein
MINWENKLFKRLTFCVGMVLLSTSLLVTLKMKQVIEIDFAEIGRNIL